MVALITISSNSSDPILIYFEFISCKRLIGNESAPLGEKHYSQGRT